LTFDSSSCEPDSFGSRLHYRNAIPSELHPLGDLLLRTLCVQGSQITQIREVFLKIKLLTPTWRSPARCTPYRAYRVLSKPMSVFLLDTSLFSELEIRVCSVQTCTNSMPTWKSSPKSSVTLCSH
jgi:hypothetical protein